MKPFLICEPGIGRISFVIHSYDDPAQSMRSAVAEAIRITDAFPTAGFNKATWYVRQADSHPHLNAMLDAET